MGDNDDLKKFETIKMNDLEKTIVPTIKKTFLSVLIVFCYLITPFIFFTLAIKEDTLQIKSVSDHYHQQWNHAQSTWDNIIELTMDIIKTWTNMTQHILSSIFFTEETKKSLNAPTNTPTTGQTLIVVIFLSLITLFKFTPSLNISQFGNTLQNIIDPSDNWFIKALLALIILPIKIFPPNTQARYSLIFFIFALLTMFDFIFRPLIMFLPKITSKMSKQLNGDGPGSYRWLIQETKDTLTSLGLAVAIPIVVPYIKIIQMFFGKVVLNLIPPLFVIYIILGLADKLPIPGSSTTKWFWLIPLIIFLFIIPPICNLVAFFQSGLGDILMATPCYIAAWLWLMPNFLHLGLENVFSNASDNYQNSVGPGMLNAMIPNTLGSFFITGYICRIVGVGNLFKTMIKYLKVLKPELLVLTSIPFTFYMQEIWGPYTDKDIPTYMTIFCLIYWLYARVFGSGSGSESFMNAQV